MRRMFTLAMLAVSAGLAGQPATAPQQNTPHHHFDVSARRYEFLPSRLEVHAGDLVRITLRSEDIPHSFVLDAYRIAKRAAAGGSVTFEFLADQPGEFPFYCNLHDEDGCRNMKGTLVVAAGGNASVSSAARQRSDTRPD
jgi:cytochrome c oxidase subunit II